MALPKFRVFPLHDILFNHHGVPSCTCPLGARCDSIGKHPMVPWKNYVENTKGPGGGYGIQTGRFNDILVVDLANKSSVRAFTALGPIPETLSVLTPSGGLHLYFRLPPDVHVSTSHGVLGPGIDIKGEGGFVVGPGSPGLISNGGVYQEPVGSLADLSDLSIKRFWN